MESSSLSTTDEILPYQFEPLMTDEESSGWETVDEVDSDAEEESLKAEERNKMESEK